MRRKLFHRRHSQVVRQGIANPSSPVRIWVSLGVVIVHYAIKWPCQCSKVKLLEPYLQNKCQAVRSRNWLLQEVHVFEAKLFASQRLCLYNFAEHFAFKLAQSSFRYCTRPTDEPYLTLRVCFAKKQNSSRYLEFTFWLFQKVK